MIKKCGKSLIKIWLEIYGHNVYYHTILQHSDIYEQLNFVI